MATTKPRIQVTLSKASYRVLHALAKRHSRSMSALAADVLNDMLPSLEAALEAAAEMRKLPVEEQAFRRAQLDLWTMQAQGQLARHNEALQAAVRPSAGVPSAGEDAAKRPAARRSTPPKTNRGVETTK